MSLALSLSEQAQRTVFVADNTASGAKGEAVASAGAGWVRRVCRGAVAKSDVDNVV